MRTSIPAHVLVIDDDEMLLLTTKGLLEGAGYEVSTHAGAFGASSAITRLRPDLILLDVNMPGLSGLGLVESLRANSSHEPMPRILLHSSNDADQLRLAVQETGVTGYVCKGDSSELKTQVAAALSR